MHLPDRTYSVSRQKSFWPGNGNLPDTLCTRTHCCLRQILRSDRLKCKPSESISARRVVVSFSDIANFPVECLIQFCCKRGLVVNHERGNGIPSRLASTTVFIHEEREGSGAINQEEDEERVYGVALIARENFPWIMDFFILRFICLLSIIIKFIHGKLCSFPSI